MDSDELVKLKQQLATVQLLLQHYAVWLESEHDPVKIADYKLHIEFAKNREQSFTAQIARHYLADKTRELDHALASPDIDSAGPVEFIERIRCFPSLDNPLPPSISLRQYLEEQREAARIEMDVLDAEIIECDRDLPEWKKRLDGLPGYELEVPTAPGESGGVVTPPAHSSAPDEEPRKKPAKGRPRAKKTKRDSIKRGAATDQPPPDLTSERNIEIWRALVKNPKASAKDVAEWFQKKNVPFPPEGYEDEIKANPEITTWPQLYRDCPRFRGNFQSSVTKVRKLIPKNKRPA